MTNRKASLRIESLLAGAQLPALPQSAIRLLQLSQDPENGPAEFAVPIESDPGLTGQVLKFVNSSYFGFAREISSIKLAITLVGIRTIKNFALWSAVFSLMPNPKCGPFDLKSLWQDSLRRGLFARAMGRLLGQVDSEDLFAAALLQDMAVPLLAKELPEEYDKLFQARQSGTHAAVGTREGAVRLESRGSGQPVGPPLEPARGVRRPDRMPHEIRRTAGHGSHTRTGGREPVGVAAVGPGRALVRTRTVRGRVLPADRFARRRRSSRCWRRSTRGSRNSPRS